MTVITAPQPETVTASAAVETVIGLCGICPSGCAMEIRLEAGRLTHLTPLKDHPLGLCCPRGMRAPEIIYSPDRLLYPQKRVGARGEGKFERITWDEAYDLMVRELRRIAADHGPEALCMYTGRGNFEFGLNEMFAPAGTVESSANAVLFPLGSPNTTGVGALCYVSYGMIAPRACFGEYMRDVTEDLEHADLIFVWGENPATDSPPLNLRRLKRAQARGARVVVIDHRRSETAKALRAEWVGVRPGTDGALALGLLNVLIQEDLYDREFVTHWTHGFPELRDYAAPFTPERVAAITGVAAATVVELARAIGGAQGFSILMYSGLEYSNSGAQSIRGALILQALAGHLDTPGGKRFQAKERVRFNRRLTPPPSSARPPIGAAEYPIYYEVRQEAHAVMLPQAILEGQPYPLKALLVSGTSLLTAWPNPERWGRALAALDFLVVVNRFPTADAAYADLVLPAATMFEIESYMDYGGWAQHRRKVIEPLGEARNDYLIWAELAQRLGYGHLWPQTEAAMVACALEGTGITYAELTAHPAGLPYPEPEPRHRQYASGHLRADGRPGFNTPTGKFEIASEWFRGHGYEPLPVYVEPREGPLAAPELAARFPLVLNTGARIQSDFRSQHHNIPSLVAQQPWPLVHLHLTDAAARGLQDGDDVWVVSPRGRVPFRLRVTDDIVPGAVEANMGGGGPLGPAAWQASNVNVLTDLENRDPISGFPVYKALLCDVVKGVDVAAGG